MTRRTVAVTIAVVLGGIALWSPVRSTSQEVRLEQLVLELDSVLVGTAPPPVPLGHSGFAVTLRRGDDVGTVELTATNDFGAIRTELYRQRSPGQ